MHVSYMQGGRITTVAAKAVMMATPKFMTAHIVEGLPREQRLAMQKIRYAPYCVVNLIYDKVVFDKGYDTWCPGHSFTDFIVADWTIRNDAGYKRAYNILTCYTPMRETETKSAAHRGRRTRPCRQGPRGREECPCKAGHRYLWKYTSIAAAIPCIWPRPATTPGCYRWRGARWIASFLPTLIP